MLTFSEQYPGNIKYALLTEEYYEGALNLLELNFFTRETTSVACGLSEDEESRNDLRRLCLEIAKNGNSVIAIDTQENKIAGVSINQIHEKGNSFYEQFSKTCKKNSSRNYLKCMLEIDNLIDFFEKYNCTCYMELLFLTTHPDYQGKNIATKLTEYTIYIAEQLKHRRIVKQASHTEGSLDPIPSALIAILTSKISQKLVKKCSLEVVSRIPYEDIKFNGKSLYELLGNKEGEIITGCKNL
ncbi:hypothetical protein WA026_000845 [Henosepilachna vigintioctopunctata]|uniref:N-acetyltransferase domain-containing protein n=1 Tax=Henosepilachna vigintioctopunctata TaxID=420089 RepID=A0AAW1V555_9CUCU